MTTGPGYSDTINHAFAFAAKHHDRQVRKGTKLPYLTHPANVAVILSRYGRDDKTVVAGILHDVVEDCVRDGYTREMLTQRIGDKFGADVLAMVLGVTHRRLDDDGVELSSDQRKQDYLHRLAEANDEARWVCAADKVHNANSVLSDLRRTEDPNSVWSRFSGGQPGTVKWYRAVLTRLDEIGFREPIMAELRAAVTALESER
ncbi:MAG: HD domain-containing protein [Gemmatimonadota bacterium]|nr:HD domain-containing protein [Gemmatimonadota bacterium]